MRISHRGAAVGPFQVMEILERAQELERQGRRIIHLEVGQPDFETPEPVREAAVRALREGHTRYTHSLGRPELREAIAECYWTDYGVRVDPGRVVVTLGSSAALLLVFAALTDPGDGVLLSDPGYPCYSRFVQALGGAPRWLPVGRKTRFQPAPELVGEAWRHDVRALVVNSPSNPAGTLYPEEWWPQLAEAVGDRMAVVSDEIYHGLVYEGRARSVLEYLPDGIVVSGFSKLFAMTGWRLGYAVIPPKLVRVVQNLQQNLFISAADFVQIAAVAALRHCRREVEEMRRTYDRRRRLVLDRLERLGLEAASRPEGAFYVLVDVSAWADDVVRFSHRLLEEAGVAVTPGTDFGSRGQGLIRLSYAVAEELLEEGLTRLGRFLEVAGGGRK